MSASPRFIGEYLRAHDIQERVGIHPEPFVCAVAE